MRGGIRYGEGFSAKLQVTCVTSMAVPVRGSGAEALDDTLGFSDRTRTPLRIPVFAGMFPHPLPHHDAGTRPSTSSGPRSRRSADGSRLRGNDGAPRIEESRRRGRSTASGGASTNRARGYSPVRFEGLSRPSCEAVFGPISVNAGTSRAYGMILGRGIIYLTTIPYLTRQSQTRRPFSVGGFFVRPHGEDSKNDYY